MSDISWLDIGITYGDLAQSIKNQDSELIGKHIHSLITTILISTMHGIDGKKKRCQKNTIQAHNLLLAKLFRLFGAFSPHS